VIDPLLSPSRSPLLAVLLVAFCVRVFALWPAAHATLVNDERSYVQRAEALLDGQGFLGSYQSWVRHQGTAVMDLPQYPGAFQPPGYTAFVAGVMALSGRSLTAVRLVQVVLSTLTVWLVYRLGLAWFGARPGLAAAWLCALSPELIAFSHYFWSETLFTFLMLAGLTLLARGSEPPGRAAAALAGLALGLAVLTRSALAYFLPVLGAWVVFAYAPRRRTALARCALAGLVAVAVVAPWTARNWAIHGGFVLIDSNGPYNVWRGNVPLAYSRRGRSGAPVYQWPFETIPVAPVAGTGGGALVAAVREETGKASPSDLEIMAFARRAALASILGDPLTFLSRARYKLIDMWNPTSFFVRHVETDAYGRIPFPLKATLRFISFASHLALIALAAHGWLLGWRDPRVWLVVAFAAFFTGISVLAFGLTRFRVPLLPLLCLLGGLSIARLGDRIGGRHAVT
jgi:4-amino-4-deoxy-L-arabinose transferase-like glycosyltransferase